MPTAQCRHESRLGQTGTATGPTTSMTQHDVGLQCDVIGLERRYALARSVGDKMMVGGQQSKGKHTNVEDSQQIGNCTNAEAGSGVG